jgi:hypothetical protein
MKADDLAADPHSSGAGYPGGDPGGPAGEGVQLEELTKSMPSEWGEQRRLLHMTVGWTLTEVVRQA